MEKVSLFAVAGLAIKWLDYERDVTVLIVKGASPRARRNP